MNTSRFIVCAILAASTMLCVKVHAETRPFNPPTGTQVTDNVSPTHLQFRTKAPGDNYTAWVTANLAPGYTKNKEWSRAVSLVRKGKWSIQIRTLDAQGNISKVSTVTITRR